MKRLLISAGTLVFVGALAVSATGAFFSDTETSTGNTFASGAIDLLVDSEAHYDGLVCVDGDPPMWQEDENGETETTRPELIGEECGGTWEQTDLGPTGFAFFNFFDLKPGDHGENTISLHVIDNDAWMCAIIDNMEDVEVAPSCTEPEAEDGDVTCDLDTPHDGELADELHFFAWLDQGATPGFSGADEGEGDNIWGGQTAEPPLFSNLEGPASDVLDGVVYPLFTPDINDGAFMMGTTTYYIGLYWCYGDITVGDGTLECDGAPVDNQSQTDQLTADITFYAEQARNNPNFTCPEPGDQDPPVEPEPGSVTVIKVIEPGDAQNAIEDFNLFVGAEPVDSGVGESFVPGSYVISETENGGPLFEYTTTILCDDDDFDGTDTITVEPGEIIECTVTNDETPFT